MDRYEKQSLILEHLNTAHAMALKWKNKVGKLHSFDELLSCANLGLTRAAQTYDPDKGVSFTTWSYFTMENEIRDFLRANDDLTRRERRISNRIRKAIRITSNLEEIATIAGTDEDEANTLRGHLENKITVTNDIDFFDAFKREESSPEKRVMTKDQINKIMAYLKPEDDRDHKAFYLARIEGKTQVQIAKELGLDQSRISQIVKDMERKLRRRFG